jgi:hypothetical protein
MPIELARWKVGRTFHLARPLYRPRRHPGFLRDSILAAFWEPLIILTARPRAALGRRNRRTAPAPAPPDIDKAPAKEIDGAVAFYRPTEAALAETINAIADRRRRSKTGMTNQFSHC